MNKMFKVICSFVAVIAMTSSLVVANVAAAPTIVAKVDKNGILVDLQPNEVATSKVTLVSDTACTWYSGTNSISEGYSTTKDINKGYSLSGQQYFCVDKDGHQSNTITVKMDYNQPNIINFHNNTKDGANEVELVGMKENVSWIVDGSDRGNGKTFTVSGKGNHTVYTIGADGTKSNTLTFSIPYYKNGAPTTTTTKAPVVTTKPNTTTTSYKQSTSIALTLKDLNEGEVTNKDVVLEADQNAFFVVNGNKAATVSKSLTISEEGTYAVYATNLYNTVNSVTYHFTIDKSAPTIKLKVNNAEVAPGVLEDAVTVVTNEVGIFYVNNEQANIREQNELVISESGNYSILFKDMAGNSSVINFVVKMPEGTTPNGSSSNAASGVLYMVGGAFLGGVVVAIVMFVLNRKKNDEEDEDEE